MYVCIYVTITIYKMRRFMDDGLGVVKLGDDNLKAV